MKVGLNRTGRRLLRKLGRLKLRATATIRDASGNRVISLRTFRIKRR